MASQRPEIVLGFAFGGRIRAAFEERFEVLGVVERPDPPLVTPAMAARARGLVTMGSLPTGDAFMAALPKLSIICCYGTGYEGVDLAAARRRNITVVNSPEVNAPDVADMVSVPGDCPFLPDDLVERLAASRQAAGVPLACARSGEWRHPTVALWRVALRDDLRKAVAEEGLRKIESWTARHGVAIADWSDRPVDPFFNVNTPEDIAAAERIAAQQCGD